MCRPILIIAVLINGILAPQLIAENLAIMGYWQNINNARHYVGFEKGRFMQFTPDEEYRHFTVKDLSKNSINIPNLGPALSGGRSIPYLIEGEDLKIRHHSLLDNKRISKAGYQTFRKLTEKPPELDFKYLKIARAKPLSNDLIQSISEELIARRDRDQAARRGEYTTEDHLAQVGDHRWLREQILKIGWIDMKRFDPQVSQAAFLIAQHSFDLRLRLAAQKGLKADFKRRLPAQAMYAILYDRNKLYMHGTQRYGTHFYSNKELEIQFLPFENRSKIEQWRRELKLPSFEKFLKGLSKSYPQHKINI